jgi:hypothetical protein
MFRLIALMALVALAGCHKETRSGDQRTATGQVLAGTISDSMIPYEQLQSRPPAAPRVVEKAAGKAGTADSSGDGDAAVDAPAADAPAAAASPSAPPAIHY